MKKLAWLSSAACRELVAGGRLQHSQVEAQKRELHKTSAHIARIAPTPAWRDEFEAGGKFPPRADDPASAMRTAERVLCDAEGDVLWPSAYLQNGSTFDVVCLRTEQSARAMEFGRDTETRRHGDTETSSGSSSADAIAAAADRQATIVEVKLEPEDEESLCEEVLRYTHAGTMVSRSTVMSFNRR